ncbi:HET-domain-containing protein, partial [Setomelanomma holmii]
YACLSHCWGGFVPLRTTKATMEEFERGGILWEDVLLTFKHAIEMTYQLGLRYLWIDSLYIVRDDMQDWRHEGSKKAEIYAGSYVTVAAMNAPDSTAAFYLNGSRPYYRDWTIDFQQDDDSSKTYQISVHQLSTESDFESLPLMQRAWFFQERLLTPRIVHFADDVLYWECLEHTTDELGKASTNILNSKSYLLGAVEREPPQSTHARPRLTHSGNKSPDGARKWHRIVEAYTCLNLTFSKDKLPALQGVARSMQTERSGMYCAGLWEDTL